MYTDMLSQSVFQVVQGFSAPAGRCSSALMLRCTPTSRGSSRYLHSSKRADFAVVSMASEHLIKLFRDMCFIWQRPNRPVWRHDTPWGCNGLSSHSSSWCWAGCQIRDSANRRDWLASLSDSHGAGLWCSTPTDRPERRSVFPRLVQCMCSV